MRLSNAQSKLLRSGFVLDDTGDPTSELWIGATGGRSIRLYKDGERVISLRVYGDLPDQPQYDEFHSYYTSSAAAAIRVALASRRS